jgi:hypothetical protein
VVVNLEDGTFTGEVELFIEGKSVIDAKGLILRQSSDSIIKGMHFETFFGGR